MTGSAITCCALLAANAIALTTVATANFDALLEYVQNGASVGAVMGLFLWREMHRAERYEHLYDEERRKRTAAENKCSNCVFVRRANEAFLDGKGGGASPPSD